jgi:hypothetical protein
MDTARIVLGATSLHGSMSKTSPTSTRSTRPTPASYKEEVMIWIMEACIAWTVGLGCTASVAEAFDDVDRCYARLEKVIDEFGKGAPGGVTLGRCVRQEKEKKATPKRRTA